MNKIRGECFTHWDPKVATGFFKVIEKQPSKFSSIKTSDHGTSRNTWYQWGGLAIANHLCKGDLSASSVGSGVGWDKRGFGSASHYLRRLGGNLSMTCRDEILATIRLRRITDQSTAWAVRKSDFSRAAKNWSYGSGSSTARRLYWALPLTIICVEPRGRTVTVIRRA